ncbi:serine hydrolase domain-containing protein [Streptomyces sp. NPDC048387]|uniref:serine hydrolase domain-containing protein n=1 Tax=Streptomyces sp. NPDC048387 TaxID=3365542 RepID=UPI00371677AF
MQRRFPLLSYCNSGYVVLGRLVEVLRGRPFDAVLRERLADPLGLEHLATCAEEAILFRAAVGHIEREPGAGFTPTPVWALPASNAPAGARLAMSARDLLGFARMHLAGGLAPDGTRVVSPEGIRAMAEPQVALPDFGHGTHWGLGWELSGQCRPAVIGHDGSTNGQNAYLRIVPDAGVAVALLTNGGNTLPLYQEIVGAILAEHAGVRLPAPPEPPARPRPVDPVRARGRYRSAMFDHVIDVDPAGRVWLETMPRTDEARLMPGPGRLELVRLRDDALITAEPHHGHHPVFALIGGDDHHGARYLHTSRAMPRRAGQ